MLRKSLDVAVISDLHLGTFACKANELTLYLKSIKPQILVLNGDVIDAWQFNKRYFPCSHMEVIQEIFELAAGGTQVIYITGNHDDVLRRYTDLSLGNIKLTDKVVLEVNGKSTWIFHGDVFDHTTNTQAKFWAHFGSNGYALLLAFNRLFNAGLRLFGQPQVSIANLLMGQFNKRIIKVEAFENMIANIAIDKGYDFVICGHIHEPKKRVIVNTQGQVTYLNCGDWVSNLTALELNGSEWELVEYEKKKQERKTQPKLQSKMVVVDESQMKISLQSI